MTETTTITTRECMFCGKTSHIEVTATQAGALAAGHPVHTVLPQMPPALREVLISGTHPECWQTAFN
jgi:hypothetical protein